MKGDEILSAFGSPWGDIDNTRPGSVYVVGTDGWGWFALFILASIPFLIIGGMLTCFSAWVCQHPILVMSIYEIFSLLVGVVFYMRPVMRHRICGVIASVLTVAPLGMDIALYAIPYLLLKGTFSAIFDWVLVAALLFGIAFFIFSICNLLKNGIPHLVMALIFFILSATCIIRVVSLGNGEISWQVIRALYGL